jgi:two-component system sensor histidine kinase BarA
LGEGKFDNHYCRKWDDDAMKSGRVLSTIHQKLLLMSFIPLALLSMAMGWYMISAQNTELLDNLYDTGRTAASQTASNAEFALQSGDRELLEVLAYSALEIPAVTGVLFASYQDGKSLNVGSIDFDQMPDDFDSGSPFYLNNHWYFYADILDHNTLVEMNDSIFDPQPVPVGWALLQLTDQYLSEKRYKAVVTTLAVIFLSLLLAFWLSVKIGRAISMPLRSLTEVVEKMEQGDLQTAASKQELYELDKLAIGINSLANTVRDSKVSLENEIAQATSQLQVTLVDLEEAMRAKDQFLARMSHELRTPLTAVMGFTNLLSREEDEAERRKHLRMIQRCSAILLTVIDDVLDFSKANVDGVTLKLSSFNLQTLIGDTTTVFSKQATDKGLIYEVVIEENVPQQVYGDPARLAQILTNLFNNAIKFTTEGGIYTRVKFIDQQDDLITLEFSVKDTGKGIAKEKIPTLFEPFIQEDSSINRRFGGSGLGLSIAKTLVEAMGGSVHINSEVDVGSTVTFSCRFSEPQVDSARERFQKNLSSSSEILSGVSILVAEDNPFNQELLLKLFKGYGAHCTVAQTGLEAIEMANNPDIDVVLMDMHMPEVDGIAATDTIVRQCIDYPPIIGLTADIVESERQKMILAGAVKVLLKPIDEVQLINAILDVVSERRETPAVIQGGLLAAVLPPAELKIALLKSITQLKTAFSSPEKVELKEIIHDLLGLCGLYGMTDLRELVLDLSNTHSSLSTAQNLQKIKKIHKFIETSKVLKEQS